MTASLAASAKRRVGQDLDTVPDEDGKQNRLDEGDAEDRFETK